MNQKEALAFVERHGVVLQAARGPLPNLAEWIVGGRIRGSWWGHPKGKEIFRATKAICESPNVLVCKLVEGKITCVHRRLWPALVKLASRFREEQLAKVWDEHTASGAHQSRRERFPIWVPSEVMKEAKALSVAEAESILSNTRISSMIRLSFANSRSFVYRLNKTMFFDDLPLEMACPKCGKQINETVKWLKAESRKCPFCGTLIDTTEFRRGIDEATNRTHEMLQNLQESLRSIKIRIKL